MGQVNVNTPGDGTSGASAAVITLVVVVLLVVLLLVLWIAGVFNSHPATHSEILQLLQLAV
jgi:hypothetical protein